MIWHDNAYNLVPSLGDDFVIPCMSSVDDFVIPCMSSVDDFVIPCMSSVTFYKLASQQYNKLHFTASGDKKLTSEVSESRPAGTVH